MAPNEKEDIYNVQGYIKAGMIVLHSAIYDHDDNDGHSVCSKIICSKSRTNMRN